MHLPFSCTDYLLFCMLNGWWYYWWTTSSTEVVSSVFPLYFDYPYYPPISYSTIHNNNIPLNNVIITNDWVDSIVPPFSLVKLALHAFFFLGGRVHDCLSCTIRISAGLRHFVTSLLHIFWIPYELLVSLWYLWWGVFDISFFFFSVCIFSSYIYTELYIVTTSLIFLEIDNNI